MKLETSNSIPQRSELASYGYWNVTDNSPCGGTVTCFVSAPSVSCQKLISCLPGVRRRRRTGQSICEQYCNLA